MNEKNEQKHKKENQQVNMILMINKMLVINQIG